MKVNDESIVRISPSPLPGSNMNLHLDQQASTSTIDERVKIELPRESSFEGDSTIVKNTKSSKPV